MIEFKQVTKEYGQEDALKHLSLTIGDGELFVLVGPSGSGKTTLLKMINRLVVPTSGQVLIDQEDVAQVDLEDLRRHTGYVLQTGALFPNMTVEQNAGIQLEALGWPAEKRHARIAELLKRMDLDPALFLKRMPSELSGGEAQRVGIVRALAAKPKLVLMDEPFSALDPLSKRQLQALILQLHQELATTFVFVTHDMREAIHLADRLAVIHDGELQQLGTPAEILAAPANDFVRDFFDDVQQTQFLQRVLAAGFGQKVPTTEMQNLPAFKNSDTIYQWAQLLQKQPQQNIQVAGCLLTPLDLVNYMASLNQGGEQGA
ncbi:ABC transporter ATP-binding protein [Lapidilactobacillus wuchangensis]|uniref:ABC transporter ATP-binding protein n=1 Tax=Lapidilactobacillus wuchangensis TaxID=2486001 RepID=UPI000F797B93|nr:ABC transporter ATP-binding protein [Lapidilactobacillus wuchangensis]